MGKLSYNMYEAKTKLSEIVEKARDGNEVILMNRGVAVAKVVPLRRNRAAKRPLGFAKDIKMLSGFDAIPEGFKDYE